MAKTVFFVYFSRDNWWVDFNGKSAGPYTTKAAAIASKTAVTSWSGRCRRSVRRRSPADRCRSRPLQRDNRRPRRRIGAFRLTLREAGTI
jgi:hypothetical protein